MEDIVCDKIFKDYKGETSVRALDHIDLSVSKGEFFGLLGPNGAGKTTLVRILATLLKASGGCAWVGGYDVNKDEKRVREIIGYAGQDSERSAYFRLSVKENLFYFAHALRDVPREIARERIEYIASAIGFEDRLDRHFIALSGGEKQVVIVMRALLHNPEVCFLDEPSKSLDPITAHKVRRFIKDYARENGITICLTTHNMLEVEEVCDRIAFINRGKLIFVGTPSEFKRRAAMEEIIEISTNKLENDVKLRVLKVRGVINVVCYNNVTKLYCEDAFNALPEVLNIMREARLKVPVRITEPSLEDAFAFFVNGGRSNE
ncbi:MAG: ABC transporter ATP-binding protein [Nitrososphaerota archaeon]|nr:ABC transporter ATP-binding protein [Candidatus Bathyarchaeota archaeon]MDW8048558.1 ABC transporter ATP-binding protein [Nitrososphaerota archaeon]